MSQEFYIAGIAAPTSAGKTTLLRVLEQRIQPPPTVFSFDEYDLYPLGSAAMDRELEERSIVNWEDPSLFDQAAYLQDLKKIIQGIPLVLQTRSRESIEQGEQRRVITPGGLTIVEGIFIYHDPGAREIFNLRFYIDIPPEEMMRRRQARTPKDSPYPWDDLDYITGEMVRGTELYVTPQRAHAHVILDGLLPTSELAEKVIAEINQRRRR